MQEAFRLGGWGMYPTLFVGIVLVIAAARFAANPARGRLPVVGALAVLVGFTSLLGFVTGTIKTLTANPDVSTHKFNELIAIGIGESLVNVGFGLCLLVLASFGVIAGLARRAPSSRGGVTAVDPHNA